MKTLLKLSSLALLVSGAALAQNNAPAAGALPQATPPPVDNKLPNVLPDKATGDKAQPNPGEALKNQGISMELDRDADGKITRAEAKVDRTLASRFGKLDINGDGVLTKDEVEGKLGAGAQPATAVSAGPFDFARLDIDGSGKLSRKEAGSDAALSAKFSKADSNKDGELSKDEIEKSLKQ